MEYLAAVILGILQGIFEWLPVSSEGIVTLAGKLIYGMEYQESLAMAIWLHVGTFVAAVAYFRNDLIEMLKCIYTGGKSKSLLVFLAVSTIVSAIVAVPLIMLAFSEQAALIPDYLFTIMIGAFLLIVSYLQKTQQVKPGSQEPAVPSAIVAGFAQGLAVLPGLSRSGITLAALISQRYNVENALKLSFLMSIPVVFGVQLALPLVKSGGFEVTGPMLAGALAAAITGFATINLLLEFARRTDFHKATAALGALVIIIGVLSAIA
ncbi:MAG: undecaprenyl-diphosphate phosphatase [Candidatus Micrarchaeota archaeon]|nr:undecaprenyl-diphosphate phosphatase [Candidatus Micrarchaeota archaeon]